jgi:hypothetical protein
VNWFKKRTYSNLIQDWTAIKDAEECDFGTGIPSSTRPRICISIASCICSSASSRVFPVAMHPGRSGEYAKIVLSGFFDYYQEPVHRY